MRERSKALEDVMYETSPVHNHVVTIVAVEVEEGAVRVVLAVVEAVDEDEEEIIKAARDEVTSVCTKSKVYK